MNLKGIFLRLIVAGLVLSGFSVNSSAADTTRTKQSTSAKSSDKRKASDKASAATKIDINTASETELETLPGVGKATAEKIISNRPYSSVKDLKKAGLSAKAIQKIQPLASARRINEAAGAAAPATQTEPQPSKRSGARAKTSESTTTESRSERTEPAAPTRTRSASEDAAAASSGKVWVNTDSKIYHRLGDRWYGNTKEGKYMTLKEAEAAGYHESKQGGKEQ
ncbi:MAG: hypothetical protein JWO95_2318 [Verrucomicrobiales bacterium]|nr:hypothetical protein [Verrucomicrobiales bacterium]